MKTDYEYLLPDRPIAFNRDFVRLEIGVKGALMLSQAIYWHKRTSDPDNWFYKTQSEWENETGLTSEEQKTVNKILIGTGLIKIEKRGLPARNYYQVQVGAIFEALSSKWLTDLSWQTPPTSGGKSHPLTYTESTTDTSAKAEKIEVVKEEGEPKSSLRGKKVTPEMSAVFGVFDDQRAQQKLWPLRVVEREAAKALFDEYGIEKLKKRYKIIKENRGNDRCPDIFKPSDFLSKMANMEKFLQRQ